MKFVTCADVNPESSRAFAERFGCDSHYSDFEEMLKREKVDGVVLGTWPAQHAEQIQQVLDAGVKYILCEKALTTDRDSALAIWQAAKDADATVLEAFMYLYHPLIEQLDEMVRSSGIGQIDTIRGASSVPFPETADVSDPSRGWRYKKDVGGGVVWDLTCYPVNVCGRYAGALPETAQAVGTVGRYGSINRLYGVVSYANGCVGIVESSASTVFNQEIQINAADAILQVTTAYSPPGDVVVRRRTSPKRFHVEVAEHVVRSPIPLQEDLPTFYPYQPQLETFARITLGQDKPRLSLAESIVNSLVLDALATSALENRLVPIEIPGEIADAWENARL